MNSSVQKPERKAFYEEFAEKVIGMLEQGTAPWQKPWTPNNDLVPHNPVSGTVYRGGNRVWLSIMAEGGDNRWMTFKQASEAGYKIKKGSRSVPIEFATFEKRIDVLDESGNPVLD
ncbi:MAG: ArdC family protein, partial [Desulfovibrionaceae bacterium]|nr:ArdC family protein [Desulfovibrionaceae bacterium]